jgi:hypothetical protein
LPTDKKQPHRTLSGVCQSSEGHCKSSVPLLLVALIHQDKSG